VTGWGVLLVGYRLKPSLLSGDHGECCFIIMMVRVGCAGCGERCRLQGEGESEGD
jgi:hypothetical protein